VSRWRVGAGGIRARLRIRRIVEAATLVTAPGVTSRWVFIGFGSSRINAARTARSAQSSRGMQFVRKTCVVRESLERCLG
jgi:hypothetical protein